MATLNQLKRIGKRAYRRVGRGQSSGRGKQSGRGGKGQTARAGHKVRPELRDIIKKLPKRRGYGKNRGRTVDGTKLDAVAISLEILENLFESGAEVTHKALAERGAIHARKKYAVKIVGGGALTKKLSLKGIFASASAKAAIEKAGGTIA
jgi:large subunit ribosomal protein L15